MKLRCNIREVTRFYLILRKSVNKYRASEFCPHLGHSVFTWQSQQFFLYQFCFVCNGRQFAVLFGSRVVVFIVFPLSVWRLFVAADLVLFCQVDYCVFFAHTFSCVKAFDLTSDEIINIFLDCLQFFFQSIAVHFCFLVTQSLVRILSMRSSISMTQMM